MNPEDVSAGGLFVVCFVFFFFRFLVVVVFSVRVL